MRGTNLLSPLFVVTSLLLLSCGAGVPAPRALPSWARALPDDLALEGSLVVRPEETEDPPLELRFPWRNDGAMLGWGSAHLWARPSRDHVSVTAILDAPATEARWRGCERVELITDGRRERVPSEYIGRPMNRQTMVYEAVHLHLGVQHLRAIAAADRAVGRVCGDELRFTPDQQATIARFVEWFDHLAAPRWYGHEPYFRDVGPEPDLPLEQEIDLDPVEG